MDIETGHFGELVLKTEFCSPTTYKPKPARYPTNPVHRPLPIFYGQILPEIAVNNQKKGTMSAHNTGDLNLNIDRNELKPLFKTNPYHHVFALVKDWVIIALSIYICLQYFNPISYVLAVTVIGARMHAMSILMHDATHFLFLKNRKWNDLLTNFFTMYPLFTTIATYRQNHLRHHQHLNTDHDPDWVAKLGVKEFTFPKTRKEFLTTVLSYFTLYQGASDAIWFLKRFQLPQKTEGLQAENKMPRILFLALLVITLTVAKLWFFYLIFWVVPYLSTFFMFQYIRSVAEHFGDMAYDSPLTSSRTVYPTPLERFFIAPHNVGYHLEHHLFSAVPFYNLPLLHELLMKDSKYNEQAHLTQGYMSGLLNELGQFGESGDSLAL